MGIHSGEKPVSMQTLDKALSFEMYIETYMKTCAGENSYLCSHCDKAFT